MKSDPPLFTEEWWELFNWFMQEAKKRGMAVSLSDYSLCTPGQGFFSDEVIKNNPGIEGSILVHDTKVIKEGEKYILSLSEKANESQNTNTNANINEKVLCIMAYKYENYAVVENTLVDLTELINKGDATWEAPKGNWIVVKVSSVERIPSIDFMNPIAGKEVIKEFFQKFEDRNHGEGGEGLNYFFSDELSFNIQGNMWNSIFKEEFIKRKGYDILPFLPAIFMDIGRVTQKIRLDYKDVLVQLEEENYFKPVFEWHEQRGMTYGCDHGGRGRDVTEFGDYFRTQRWNQGPGNDQPALQSNIIKNKVSSSIAHMYKRPRTWLEGFYSSGWGTSTAAVADATFRNFAMGHNLLTLHGLYYSTHGGWWEWAPPCNHFRQPYWEHMGEFLHCSNRLSYLLSQGVHVCDVAIVYPVAAMEGGLDGETAVKTAFDAGEYFYNNGLDLDFIDFESVERAKIEDGELKVSGESFKVLVIPSMKTVRFGMYKKILNFHRAGGIVICIGALPEASDHDGREDKALEEINREIFVDSKNNHVTCCEQAYKIITSLIKMDFKHEKLHSNNIEGNINKIVNANENANRNKGEKKIYFIHRRVNTKDVYMIYGVLKGEICSFRAKGNIELWNPWTGEACGLTALKVTEQGTSLKMPLEENELQIIVFDNENTSNAKLFKETKKISEMPIEGKLNFELKPTMDNQFGDFRLPSFEGFIGAEIRRLEHSLDGENWSEVSCGYGPRFMKLGPLQDTEEIIEFEKGIIEEKYISEHEKYKVNDKLHNFKRYEYSDRMCIEGDPGHQGYHGLKGEMSDEFLFTGKPNFTWTSTEYLAEEDGDIYYFWSTVDSPIEQEVSIKISDFSPVKVRINGASIEDNKATLRTGTNRILLKYKGAGRGYFIFETEAAPDVWEQSYPLSMTWHNKPGVLGYDILPNGNNVLGRYRFTSAPALKELTITAYGKLEVIVDGKAPKLLSTTNLENGSVDYRFSVQSMNKKCSNVELSIIHEKGFYGGAALPEPIKMNCGEGLIELGDWSKLQGLYSYSGGAYYRRSFNLTKEQLKTRIILELGEVVSSVELNVNGNFVGIKVAPAWKFDITDFVVERQNHIEALVYNTIGNHYTSIPTRYRGEIKSGLIGPVVVSFEEVII